MFLAKLSYVQRQAHLLFGDGASNSCSLVAIKTGRALPPTLLACAVTDASAVCGALIRILDDSE